MASDIMVTGRLDRALPVGPRTLRRYLYEDPPPITCALGPLARRCGGGLQGRGGGHVGCGGERGGRARGGSRSGCIYRGARGRRRRVEGGHGREREGRGERGGQ